MESKDVPKETPEKKEKVKRVMTDKQREGLKKGMEALKAKRETLAKEKDERKKTNEVLKEKGLPLVEPPLTIKKQDIQELPKPEPVEIKLKERKQRSDKGKPKGAGSIKVSRAEFDELKTLLKTQVVAPVVAPKVAVAPVAEAPKKKLTGKELLDFLYGNK